jgi:beta-galactosidase
VRQAAAGEGTQPTERLNKNRLYRLQWNDVIYQPGELKAVAYRNGNLWAEEVVITAAQATQLKLDADRQRISADGRDLAFVTVSVRDAEGRLTPRAKNRIRFTIDGPGQIVATDNGDATDFTDFRSHERNAFNGLCLVIVRATEPGKITIHAHSDADGLNATSTTIAGEPVSLTSRPQ